MATAPQHVELALLPTDGFDPDPEFVGLFRPRQSDRVTSRVIASTTPSELKWVKARSITFGSDMVLAVARVG